MERSQLCPVNFKHQSIDTSVSPRTNEKKRSKFDLNALFRLLKWQREGETCYGFRVGGDSNVPLTGISSINRTPGIKLVNQAWLEKYTSRSLNTENLLYVALWEVVTFFWNGFNNRTKQAGCHHTHSSHSRVTPLETHATEHSVSFLFGTAWLTESTTF